MPLSAVYTAQRYHPCVQSLVDPQVLSSGLSEWVSVKPEIRYLFIVHSRFRVSPFPV